MFVFENSSVWDKVSALKIAMLAFITPLIELLLLVTNRLRAVDAKLQTTLYVYIGRSCRLHRRHTTISLVATL